MLGRLISGLGLVALRNEARAMAERAGKRAALYALAAILWLVALGYLVAAFTIWLSSELGAIAACAIVAAALAAVGLIVQVSLAMSAGRRKRAEGSVSLPGFAATDPASDASGSGSGGDIGVLAFVAVIGWRLGRQMTRK
jgi:hypothetical protein